jgi:hypothetical protein
MKRRPTPEVSAVNGSAVDYLEQRSGHRAADLSRGRPRLPPSPQTGQLLPVRGAGPGAGTTQGGP